MGHEYMLDVDAPSLSEADAVLRGIPGFEAFDPAFDTYSFRREATGTMPDATAKIDSTGIYICDNGGAFDIVTDIQSALAAIGIRAPLREL